MCCKRWGVPYDRVEVLTLCVEGKRGMRGGLLFLYFDCGKVKISTDFRVYIFQSSLNRPGNDY